MSGDDDSEKEHEPTQKRLDDARKKGDIVKSADLTTAASYAGFLLCAMALGGGSLIALGQTATTLLGQADSLAPVLLGGPTGPVAGLLGHILLDVLPWFVFPAAAALASLVAQRALTFSPEKLMPKISRVSILANAKNKFGPTGLVEFAKSFVKLAVVATVLGFFLAARMPRILGALDLEPALATAELMRLLRDFLALVLLNAVLIGGLDYGWQWFQHRKKLRMSRQEMIDEMKQQDGDPHVKQQRRQRGYAIATRQMLAEVPKADVVVVNPTHYAVALKWDRATKGAPVCVAKGTDEIAARIREAAAMAGVPIHRDPPTARALFATVDLGDEIPPEQYRAVAAAIRFAERMRKRARRKP